MWTKKYKKSINCKRPRGFSQKQYCKYTRKVGKQVGLRPTTQYPVKLEASGL